MRHRASPRFWRCYRELPAPVQRLADECYDRLRDNPRHPSLHFKKVDRFWSVRIGRRHRALGVEEGDSIVWFWVGSHTQYDRLVDRS